MKIKELFQSVGLTQSFSSEAPPVNEDDCHIRAKKKNDDSVMLTLLRERVYDFLKEYEMVGRPFSEYLKENINKLVAQ